MSKTNDRMTVEQFTALASDSPHLQAFRDEWSAGVEACEREMTLPEWIYALASFAYFCGSSARRCRNPL